MVQKRPKHGTKNPVKQPSVDDLNTFVQSCERLGFTLSTAQVEQFKTLADELVKWNARFNLVGPQTIADLYARHLLDCAQLASIVPRETLLDIGAGAGLPSIPLAILLPEVEIHACERIGKKIQFISHIKRTLGLKNLYSHNCDVADMPDKYPVITARAVAPLSELMELAYPKAKPLTTYVFPKGKSAQEEILPLNRKWMMTIHTEQSITSLLSEIVVLTGVKLKE